MSITYNIEGCRYRFDRRRATSAWIRECISREGKACGYVNFVFCGDDYLLEINRQFLGHDYYTDVITFPYDNDNHIVGGDIYISVDTVAANAAAFGQTSRKEMLRVMIHGVLHLCGYGDKTPQQEKTMRAKEDACLGLLPEEMMR